MNSVDMILHQCVCGGDGGLHAGGDRLSTSIFIVFENVIYVGRGVAGCGPRPIKLNV